MTVHAKLSASGSSRWLACPGSVRLEEGLPDSTSPYAAEGTVAHRAGEWKLRDYFKDDAEQAELDEIEASEYWCREMDHATDFYVDEVKQKALAFDNPPYIEFEERVDFSPWVPEGFGTADCVMIHGRELVVMDLKYGKGVPVEAEKNSQLMLYALGAYRAYRFAFAIEKITLGIIQPRLDNVSYWSLSLEELLDFGEMVKPIAEEAFRGSDRLTVGNHCRFCRAKARCGERATQMFAVVETVKKIEDPKSLTNDEIGFYLTMCGGVSAWITDLQDLALAEILAGRAVRGFKVVEGRSNRRITDQDKLAEMLLSNGFDEALIYKPRTLETLTNLERLVGKKDFKALSEGLVVKPQGRPTLAPESDKRPPYQKNASEMFETITN